MRYTIIISNTQARWNSLYNFYKSISINLLIPPKTMFIFSEEVTGVLQLCYIALLSLHARMWLQVQVKVVSYDLRCQNNSRDCFARFQVWARRKEFDFF